MILLLPLIDYIITHGKKKRPKAMISLGRFMKSNEKFRRLSGLQRLLGT
jgi:hypothetical protein